MASRFWLWLDTDVDFVVRRQASYIIGVWSLRVMSFMIGAGLVRIARLWSLQVGPWHHDILRGQHVDRRQLFIHECNVFNAFCRAWAFVVVDCWHFCVCQLLACDRRCLECTSLRWHTVDYIGWIFSRKRRLSSHQASGRSMSWSSRAWWSLLRFMQRHWDWGFMGD